MPMPSQHDREQPGGDLLAGGDHRVVFARVVQRRRPRGTRPTSWLVAPGHGRDHHGDLVAGIDLALDVARDVADAVDVGDRGAAELHHQAGHGGSRAPPEATGRGRRDPLRQPAREKARIHTGGVGAPQPRRLVAIEIGNGQQGRTSRRQIRPSTPAEVARFSALAAEWWDPRGKMAVAAQVQSGAARLHPRRGLPAVRARRQRLDCARRACASSTSAAAAASCASRWRGSAPPWSAPIPSADQHRGGAPACGRGRARDRLPRDHRRGAGRRRRALRRRARHGGGRARRRRARCSSRRCAEMVKPGGLMIAATLNRTLKSFALGHRRRRIRAALAAARHPSMGQVRDARTSSRPRWSGRPARASTRRA